MLKDEFKAAVFTFVTNNKALICRDELKPARKAYQALMTGLDKPSQKS